MQSEPLSKGQDRTKEEILTQHAPSKRGGTAGATMLKRGDLYLLADEAGDVPWRLPHAYGLYAHDCRFLNGLVLEVEEASPVGLAASHVGEEHSAHELTNGGTLRLRGGASLPASSLRIRRTREIRRGALHELICITNHALQSVQLRVAIRVRCEFEDLFVVKGFTDAERGTLSGPTETGDRTLAWTYQGRDGRTRRTDIVFDPAPAHIKHDQAQFVVDIGPNQSTSIALAITPTTGEGARPATPAASDEGSPRVRRAEKLWLEKATRIRTSDELFDAVLRRALLDFRVLRSRLGRRHYFAAGVPWFVTLFGRDTEISAIQTLPYGSAIARDTLFLLSEYQADSFDAYRDAEPGKILHELRRGELAHLGEIPQSPAYYGTVDATMLFLILAAEYLAWSGDLDTIRQLAPNIGRALEWMAVHGDHDGDGYFDYVGQYTNGLVNQGWKDSGNAIVNTDGSRAEPPIAMAEVQAYAFLAWKQAASLLRVLGSSGRAAELDGRADALQARFERDFWSDDLGCYVMARQRGGRPAAVVASNAGQVLWGGIASPERAHMVMRRLMQDDMFSGWGIRTLSSRERAFNPIGYHLGSVWPHDNALILAGARRYHEDECALRIFDALCAAAVHSPGLRLPEVFCGHGRHHGEPPVPYPHASAPQAWATGSIPHALWNLLGLRPDAPARRLRVVSPVLPTSIAWIELEGLRVGDAVAHLRFERKSDGSVSTDADVQGGMDVEVVNDESPTSPV